MSSTGYDNSVTKEIIHIRLAIAFANMRIVAAVSHRPSYREAAARAEISYHFKQEIAGITRRLWMRILRVFPLVVNDLLLAIHAGFSPTFPKNAPEVNTDSAHFRRMVVALARTHPNAHEQLRVDLIATFGSLVKAEGNSPEELERAPCGRHQLAPPFVVRLIFPPAIRESSRGKAPMPLRRVCALHRSSVAHFTAPLIHKFRRAINIQITRASSAESVLSATNAEWLPAGRRQPSKSHRHPAKKFRIPRHFRRQNV